MNPDEILEKLQTVTNERDELKAQLVERRLHSLETSRHEHHQRITDVEAVAIKFNLLLYLSLGGGALSALVLVRTLLGL